MKSLYIQIKIEDQVTNFQKLAWLRIKHLCRTITPSWTIELLKEMKVMPSGKMVTMLKLINLETYLGFWRIYRQDKKYVLSTKQLLVHHIWSKTSLILKNLCLVNLNNWSQLESFQIFLSWLNFSLTL